MDTSSPTFPRYNFHRSSTFEAKVRTVGCDETLEGSSGRSHARTTLGKSTTPNPSSETHENSLSVTEPCWVQHQATNSPHRENSPMRHDDTFVHVTAPEQHWDQDAAAPSSSIAQPDQAWHSTEATSELMLHEQDFYTTPHKDGTQARQYYPKVEEASIVPHHPQCNIQHPYSATQGDISHHHRRAKVPYIQTEVNTPPEQFQPPCYDATSREPQPQPQPPTIPPKLATSSKLSPIKKRGRGRPKGAKNATNAKFPRPKRPLSAYNLFFRDERERILSSKDSSLKSMLPNQDLKKESSPAPSSQGPSFGEVENEKSDFPILTSSFDNKGTSKRRGRPRGPNYAKRKPTHGKISFAELGKIVGQRWRHLDPEIKREYSARAEEGLRRHKAEIYLYNAKLREIDEQEKVLRTSSGPRNKSKVDRRQDKLSVSSVPSVSTAHSKASYPTCRDKSCSEVAFTKSLSLRKESSSGSPRIAEHFYGNTTYEQSDHSFFPPHPERPDHRRPVMKEIAPRSFGTGQDNAVEQMVTMISQPSDCAQASLYVPAPSGSTSATHMKASMDSNAPNVSFITGQSRNRQRESGQSHTSGRMDGNYSHADTGDEPHFGASFRAMEHQAAGDVDYTRNAKVDVLRSECDWGQKWFSPRQRDAEQDAHTEPFEDLPLAGTLLENILEHM